MNFYPIFGHLAFILVAFSLVVRDILWLRVISIFASIASIIFNYFVPIAPLWLVINWNLVFISINVFRIIMLLREKMGVSFSEEERELYQTLFKNFSPVEFMKLLRIGKWVQVKNDEILTNEGEKVDSLRLIYNGEACVETQNKKIATLRDGDFIGEMSFTTKGLASATVKTTKTSRLIEWEQEGLRQLLQRNPCMLFALQSVLGNDMAQKLQRPV